MAGKLAKKQPEILRYEEMEQRVLFSADVVPGLDIPAVDEQMIVENVTNDVEVEREAALEASEQTVAETRRELVFVNENVTDYERLIADLKGSTDNRIIEVVVLESDRDGIEQISEILSERTDLSAVHFISHGADGRINLGSTWLNNTTLQQNSALISGWSEALSEDGDILFYGCNVAADTDGLILLNHIAELTGADISASDDLTSSAELGGDWELEYTYGEIESTVALSLQTQENWVGLLDITTGLQGHWTFDADATDSTINNNNGTLTNEASIDTTPATNKIGPGKVLLDGFNDYVDLDAHAGDYSGLTEGTISAWVNLTGTDLRSIFGIGNSGNPNATTMFAVSDGKLSFMVGEGGGLSLIVESTASVNDGVWHHVAVTVDVTGNKLFIDGTQTAVTYITGNSSSTDFFDDTPGIDDLDIGATNMFGSEIFYFGGLLDDVRIYDRALTASDVNELFTTTSAINTAPSFTGGTGDGIVTTDFGAGDDSGWDVTVQSDGKILVAGNSDNGSNLDFALTRYNTDGSLDTTFDGDGTVTTPIGTSDDYGRSVTVQSDGKILVGGYSRNGTDNDFALTRYNTDGSLDTSFGGGDGIVTTDIGSDEDFGYSVTVQSDDKILVAGTADNDFAIVRYNTDGSLDTSFGGSGIVTTAVGSGADYGTSVAVQSDGKIVVAGYGKVGGDDDFMLVRYDTNGSLDPTFDGDGDDDGKITTGMGTGSNVVRSVTLQSDGKILVAGQAFNGSIDFALARYNIDGSLDTSFSGDGKVLVGDNTSADYGYDVAVQSDGKILLSGNSFISGQYDFLLTRLNADGSLDDTFDGDSGTGDGKVYTDFGSGTSDSALGLALQTDGKILMAGQTYNGTDNEFALVRYNTDGTLDTSFALDTTLDGTPSFTEGGAAVVLDADVDVTDAELDALNTGLGNYSGAGLTLVRDGGANSDDVFSFTDGNGITLSGGNLIKNLEIIATFDTTTTTGQLVITFTDANTEIPTSVDTDNILRQITYANSSDAPPATAQIDWTFDDGNTGSQGIGGALQAIGSTTVSITAVNDMPVNTVPGTQTIPKETTTAIDGISISDVDAAGSDLTTRLQVTAGVLNITLSGSAVISSGANNSNDLTIQGKITDINATLASLTYTGNIGVVGTAADTLVVTTNDLGNTGSGGVLQDVDNIQIDIVVINTAPSFRSGVGDGIVTTDFGASDDSGQSVTVQSDGKILVAGSSWNGAINKFALTRYNSDGSLDTTFDSDGIVTTNIGGTGALGYSVTVQADGRILVAGFQGNGTVAEFALARYNSDGSLDTTFDSDGIVTTDIGGTGAFGHSVTVQADGKILVAGYSDNGTNNEFALTRYNPDGSLDTTFDGDGIVTTDIGASDGYGYSVTVQADGKILVAGYNDSAVGDYKFALARYDSDGSLDTTFDGDGLVTTDINGFSFGQSVTVQADGKILVAGSSFNGTSVEFALARYDGVDGSLDSSFDSDGIVTTDIGVNEDSGYSVTVQTDGKILVSGYSNNGASNEFALTRYNPDGSLDTSFDSDGIVTIDISAGDDYGNSVTVQADGKILVAGISNNGADNDIALVRYNSDGSLDTSFDEPNTLDGTPSFTEGGAAVVLDVDVDVSDAELDGLNSGLGNYSGASLTLVRNGGVSTEDIVSFNAGNGITLSGGNLIKNSQIIATFDITTTTGQLVITFTDSGGEIPTSADADNILRQITYANNSDAPPATAQIDWTFDDGNTGSQGTGGALTATGSTTVTITAVNDDPVITSDGGLNIANVNAVENQTAVTTVTATDPDLPADTLTYSITGGADAAQFAIDSVSGALTFTSAPDYENPTDIGTDNVYEVTVEVSDGVGGTDSQAISVTVTDANDDPVITSDGSGGTAAVNAGENQTAVTTVTATDADLPADTLTYSITGGSDAAQFAIDSVTGDLTFTLAPDYENPTDVGTNNVYDVTVEVSDGVGGTDSQSISVTVTDVNDDPVITSDGGGATAAVNAAENQTAVTTVTATDADLPADTLTYSITGGSDAAQFGIDAVTGALTFTSAPDYENPTDVGTNNVYDVTVEVSDGQGGTDSQDISVTVTDANDDPVITSDGGLATANINAAENQTAVTTVTATDEDLPADTLSYSITGGADSAKFAIDSGTGALTFQAAPDYENPTDIGTDNTYEVTVGVSDGVGGTDSQAISVTVTPDGYVVVNTTADTADGDTSSIEALYLDKGADGFISLREAIEATNNTANLDGATPDEIRFDIASTDAGHYYYTDDGVAGQVTLGNRAVTTEATDATLVNPDPDFTKSWWSIAPDATLPSIVEALIIDGTTQTGYTDSPIIEIDGNAGGGDGLTLASGSDGSTIKSLIINRFSRYGITIDSDNNTLVGSYIGTDASGTLDLGNTSVGVNINLGDNNTIGGSGNGEGNLISGNTAMGVRVLGTVGDMADGNKIQGNLIGTDATGTVDLGNDFDGIYMNYASNTTIGGAAGTIGTIGSGAFEGNVISGNTRAGILVSGEGSDDNIIQGNYIGTDVSGIVAMANVNGIQLGNTDNTLVGGGGIGEGNVIAGNTGNGLYIIGGADPADENIIQGNFIGVGADGTTDLGNGSYGLILNHVTNTTVGGSVGTMAPHGTAAFEGNLISANALDGVYILNGNSTLNTFQGNYIGTDVTGTVAMGNGMRGITISSADGNTIGGSGVGEGNLISGNLIHGVYLLGTADDKANGNVIQGNLLGTDVNGTADLGNAGRGIYMSYASNTIIGGAAGTIGTIGSGAFEGNLISGNDGYGLDIVNVGSDGNVVRGNYIGTDVTGTVDLGNTGVGIRIYLADGNTIGGGAVDQGNLISGNNSHGVYLAGTTDDKADGNVIQGNLIGTDVTGTDDLGNDSDGIFMNFASNTTIGGAAGTIGTIGSGAFEGNVISGNGGAGIRVFGEGSDGNIIQGNYIGTDVSGNVAMGNVNGIHFSSTDDTIIGGGGIGEGNVISANTDYGVYIAGSTGTGAADGSVIQGNFIGTGADGTTDLGNASQGLSLSYVANTTIGGSAGTLAAFGTGAFEGNLISGNSLNGIYITHAGSTANTIQGNYIGTDITGTADLGNTQDGININLAHDNLVGGTQAGEANIIAYSGTDGVAVTGASATGNSILGNTIHSNTGLGIDLLDNGVTANDADDIDTGPNALQNFPIIASANTDGVNSVTIDGSLNSTADTWFRIEFFAGTTADGSGYGEAERFLGAVTSLTDANGDATFSVPLAVTVASGEYVTATATVDTSAGAGTVFGDTSEFAQNVVANIPPVAVDDSATVNEGATVIIDLAANDSDADDGLDLTSITILGAAPTNGSIVDNGDGTVTYTHDGSETLSDSFTYTIDDLSGISSNVATVSITVTPVNDAPVAVDDSATLNEGAAVFIDLAANDSDADDGLDLTSITITAPPTNGSLTDNGDGTVTYTHDGSETISDSFSYTIDDLSGISSNVAVVSITVTPVNDAPIAVDDSATVNEGQAVIIDLAANDSDADDGLDLTSINILGAPPTNGSIVDNGDGTVTYTHDGSETLSDSFTYTIDDLSGISSNVATVSITVTPVNDAPVAVDDSATLNEGAAVFIDLAANDSDADDGLDLTSITITAPPTNGSLTDNGDGTVTYTHDGSETISDSFSYTIDDLSGISSNVAVVSITVTPVNDAPIAVDDSATVNEGQAVIIDLAANDSDADDGLDLTSINILGAPPTNGSIVDNGDGTVTYTHDGSETLSDSFTYTIDDLSGISSNVATVSITVTPVNDAPVAVDDSATLNEGAAVFIDLAANDSDADDGLDLTSITITAPPTNGSLTDNGDGTVTYTHDGSETISDSFTYTIDDLSGVSSNVATVSITITPVNDAPIAVDDSASVNEGQAVIIDLAANDSDADDGLDLTSITILGAAPTNGSIVDNGDGTVTYTHDGSETLSDSFTYTIDDLSGISSNVAAVSITITPVNDAPVAVDDSATLIEGAAVNIDLAANDSDADNGLDLTSITIIAQPTNGSLTDNGDGTVTYTHDGSSTISDSFTYTIDDLSGISSNVATVSLAVTPVNDAPVAVDDSATVNEGQAVIIDLAANDSDSDDGLDLTSITITAPPTNGNIVDNGDGTVTYTHDGLETLSDSFTYTIDDLSGVSSNVAAVSITITPVNDAPVAVDDTATLNEGAAVIIDLAANDSDADDGLDLTSITIIAPPTNGSLTDNGDGTVTYTHDGSETLSDSFTYTIDDLSGVSSNVAAVTITVTPVNDAPVAVDDSAVVNEGAAVIIDLAANDSDADDGLDLTSITITAPPTNGNIVDNGDGTVTYTHDGLETLSDSFTYTIDDLSGVSSNVAAVSITVTPVNDVPVAVDDSATLNEGAAVIIDLAANDSDADDGLDLTSITIIAPPTNGSLTDNGDGTVTYTHDGSETLSDSFTYTIDDLSGISSNVAAVSITVTPVNDAPVAVDDSAVVNEGAAVIIDLAANDSDADDGLDLTSITITAPPTNGNIVDNGDGTVTYTHDGLETLSDSFTYTIDDLSGVSSNVAAVSITITPVNDVPVAVDDSATLNEDAAVIIDLAANDSDADDGLDLTSIAITALPTNGSLTDNGDGTVTYTHDGSETLSDSFTYTIDDLSGVSSNVAAVSITVTPINTAPVAVDDSVSGNEDNVITGNVLTNDTDAEFDVLTADLVTDTSNGTLILNPDGSFSYTPDADWNGTDSFTYTANDGALDSNIANVTIMVNAVNDAPIGADATFNTNEDTAYNGILPVAVDADGDTVTYALDTDAANGTVTVNSNGSFNYTPHLNTNGPDSFTYTVNDGIGGSNTYTVNVNVTAVNDTPTDDPGTDPGDDGGNGGNGEDPVTEEYPYINIEPLPPIEEYPTTGSDKTLYLVDDNEKILYLTEEFDIDTQSRRREDNMGDIYSDNNIYKEIASKGYSYFDLTDRDSVDFDNDDMQRVIENVDYNLLWAEIDEAFRSEQQSETVKRMIVTISTAFFSIGIVSYLLHAGAMLGSMLSTLPIWRGFDPIFIFAGKKRDKKKQDEVTDSAEQKLETFFEDEA